MLYLPFTKYIELVRRWISESWIEPRWNVKCRRLYRTISSCVTRNYNTEILCFLVQGSFSCGGDALFRHGRRTWVVEGWTSVNVYPHTLHLYILPSQKVYVVNGARKLIYHWQWEITSYAPYAAVVIIIRNKYGIMGIVIHKYNFYFIAISFSCGCIRNSCYTKPGQRLRDHRQLPSWVNGIYCTAENKGGRSSFDVYVVTLRPKLTLISGNIVFPVSGWQNIRLTEYVVPNNNSPHYCPYVSLDSIVVSPQIVSSAPSSSSAMNFVVQ